MKNIRDFCIKACLITETALIIIIAVICGYSYSNIVNQAYNLAGNKVFDAVVAAVSFADGDILKNWKPGDEHTPEYKSAHQFCTNIKNSFGIDYIYFFTRDGDSGEFKFILDTDINIPEPVGSVYDVPESEYITAAFEGGYIAAPVLEDEWGIFTTAYAPLYDSAGNVAAIAGADYRISSIESDARDNFFNYIIVCAPVFIIIFILAAAGYFIIYKTHKIK